jgi:hypothetical protein
MGDLSVKHGFYGPDWDADTTSAQDEAGEGLVVGDPHDLWQDLCYLSLSYLS